MRHLSWEPQPRDWPQDFDGTVSASAHGGSYRIEALGDSQFRAVFIRGDEREVLPQAGDSRSDAATAVYVHGRAMNLGGCACQLCGERPTVPPSVQAAQMLIAESFNAYFAPFEVRIAPEDVVDGAHKTINDRSWAAWGVTYRVEADEAGLPSLEFYATSRWTNERHCRISASGDGEDLEAVSEIFVFDPDSDQSAAAAEFEARNEAISQQIRERGLYPHGEW